jgi:hypothetical protein
MLSQLVDHLIQPVKMTTHPFEQLLASITGRRAAAIAVEKFQPQFLFKNLHLARQGRLGNADSKGRA